MATEAVASPAFRPTIHFVTSQRCALPAAISLRMTRARRHCRAGQLSLLRVGEAVEAGRGHYRDAGGDPAAVEGDSDGTREVLVPDMRDDHAAADTVPCHSARLRRTKPAGHDPV